MARITGAVQHIRRLQRMRGAERSPQVTQALFAAGNLIQTEAQRSITTGAVSGAGHVPSAPGEPPNADTHYLDSNIETQIVAPGKVEVASNADTSSHLEFGTSRMAARPFMRPAVAKTRDKCVRFVRDAMRAIRNGR